MWYRCAISNAILLKVNIQMLLMVLFIILRRAVLCESAYNRSIERWREYGASLSIKRQKSSFHSAVFFAAFIIRAIFLTLSIEYDEKQALFYSIEILALLAKQIMMECIYIKSCCSSTIYSVALCPPSFRKVSLKKREEEKLAPF